MESHKNLIVGFAQYYSVSALENKTKSENVLDPNFYLNLAMPIYCLHTRLTSQTMPDKKKSTVFNLLSVRQAYS